MAELYGLNHTRAYQTVPSVTIPPGEISGEVKVAYDEITLAADLAVNDVIKMMKLPANSRILDATFKAPTAGALGIASVGTESNGTEGADPDSLILASAADFGGQAILAKPGIGCSAVGYEYATETQISITCTEATTAGTGIKLQLWVTYQNV